jgi:hypothetical protein
MPLRSGGKSAFIGLPPSRLPETTVVWLRRRRVGVKIALLLTSRCGGRVKKPSFCPNLGI